MKENRYFLVNIPNPNMQQIYNLVIESEIDAIYNDKTKGFVKLPIGDTNNYGVLQNAVECTYAVALEMIDTDPNFSNIK